MSDPRDPTDRLREELAALGEAPPEAQELRAATRLAEALDETSAPAHPEALGAGEAELADLARRLRATGAPEASAADARETTARVLGTLLPSGGAAAPRERPPAARTEVDATAPAGRQRQAEAPANAPEQRAASLLGDQVDGLLAGLPRPDIVPAEIADAVTWAGLLRAQLHAEPLSRARLHAMLDEVLETAAAAPSPSPAPAVRRPVATTRSVEGVEAPGLQGAQGAHSGQHAAAWQRSQPGWIDGPSDRVIATGLPSHAQPRGRYRGRRILAAVTVAATMAASVVGVAMWWHAGGAPAATPPAALLSRSTRDVLPGTFPPTQSPTDRIDLIYQDRLRAYRALRLGAWPRWRRAEGRAAGRRPPPTGPTPALVGLLLRGGP